MSSLEENIDQMEALSPEELYKRFFKELADKKQIEKREEDEARTRFIYYEGPLSVHDFGNLAVRFDAVSEEDTFPEDCVFLDDVMIEQFGLEETPWSEQTTNKFRIIIERLDQDDE